MMKADEPEDETTTGERRRQRPMTTHNGPSNQNDNGRNSRRAITTTGISRSYYARSLSKHGQLLTYVVSTWCSWPGQVLVMAARPERQRPNGPTSPLSSGRARNTEPSTTMTKRIDMWTTRLWLGLTIACVLFHVMAMAVERSVTTILAGIVAIGLAPVVYVRQQKLHRLDPLRRIQNQLRQQVTRLHQENDRLSLQVRQLDRQTDRLQQEESKLRNIVARQGTTVEKWIELVHENRTILAAVKTTVQAELTQRIVYALIESDYDGSGCYSDDEIEHILRVRMRHLPKGVLCDENLLVRTIAASDRTLATVLALVHHVDMDHWPDHERIFRLDPAYFF